MSKKIQHLLENILKDGARTSKYVVNVNFPGGNGPSTAFLNVICSGVVFPGKSAEVIDFIYKGRNIPLPGQQKYTQTVDMTFYLEENHATRLAFLDWIEGLNSSNDSYYTDKRPISKAIEATAGASRKIAEMSIKQLDFDMKKTVAEYKLYNCFCTNVTDVSLGADQVGAVGSYTVTFAYSHLKHIQKTEAHQFG